ncbi:MAG TPA: VTT domain-containing protein [Polyangiaceae bacterium]|nr:VTT domain-containing protein [Polyangiaceae bacterium]
MTARKSTARWAILGVLLATAIIVPFVIWEDALVALSRRWLESETNRLAVAGLAALLLALDLVLPIPSSFVSAGAVAALGGVLGALAIWLGMTAGALAGYVLGRSGGSAAVERFVGRDELERATRLMARFGSAVLVVCRGVPVLAEASVLVAGAARMRFATFAGVTAAANLGLATAYALLSSFGWGGAAAVLTPFALGIAVPAVAIALAKRLERGNIC